MKLMPYSYPVYRRGITFTGAEGTTLRESSTIAGKIIERQRDYPLAFSKALSDSASRVSINRKELLRQRSAAAHILNFPGIDFKMADFAIRCRLSLSIQLHGHQSKMWLMFLCAGCRGNPATRLTARNIERYFSLAATQASVILSALAGLYQEHVKQSGTAVPRREPYYFQLRAFNSLNRASAELCAGLQQDLTLQDAFECKKYSSELKTYFEIVLGQKASPAEILRAISSGALDVFGYRSQEHDALFSARLTESEADLCGYGFDNSPMIRGSLLAQTTTKDLLNEYAREF